MNFDVRRPLPGNHMLSLLIIDTVIMQREKTAWSDHLFTLVSKQEFQTEEFHPLHGNAGVRRKETVGLLPPHLEGPR
jgi:hypothetical protein